MVEDSRTHLAGDQTIPDERVERLLFSTQVALHLVRRMQHRGRPDGLMGLLRRLLTPDTGVVA